MFSQDISTGLLTVSDLVLVMWDSGNFMLQLTTSLAQLADLRLSDMHKEMSFIRYVPSAVLGEGTS